MLVAVLVHPLNVYLFHFVPISMYNTFWVIFEAMHFFILHWRKMGDILGTFHQSIEEKVLLLFITDNKKENALGFQCGTSSSSAQSVC